MDHHLGGQQPACRSSTSSATRTRISTRHCRWRGRRSSCVWPRANGRSGWAREPLAAGRDGWLHQGLYLHHTYQDISGAVRAGRGSTELWTGGGPADRPQGWIAAVGSGGVLVADRLFSSNPARRLAADAAAADAGRDRRAVRGAQGPEVPRGPAGGPAVAGRAVLAVRLYASLVGVLVRLRPAGPAGSVGRAGPGGRPAAVGRGARCVLQRLRCARHRPVRDAGRRDRVLRQMGLEVRAAAGAGGPDAARRTRSWPARTTTARARPTACRGCS